MTSLFKCRRVSQVCLIQTALKKEEATRGIMKNSFWSSPEPRGPGVHAPSHILTTKVTLSQPGGQIMPTILILATDFQTFLRPCDSKQAEDETNSLARGLCSLYPPWPKLRNILPTIGIPFKRSNRPLGLLILEQRVSRSVTIEFFLQSPKFVSDLFFRKLFEHKPFIDFFVSLPSHT